MKKFKTDQISGNAKAPILKATLDQWNENSLELSNSLVLAGLFSYTTDDVVILHGCVVDDNIPGTSTVTAGAIYYNGEIFQVEAASIPSAANTLVWNKVTTYRSGDPVGWMDGTPRDQHRQDKFVLSNAASGSGIADFDDSTVKRKIKTKKISIGSWNMASDANKSVAHGLSAIEWRTIGIKSITIFKDDLSTNDVLVILNTPSGTASGVINYDSTNINLTRATGGSFDSAQYNDGTMNRGFILIEYGDI